MSHPTKGPQLRARPLWLVVAVLAGLAACSPPDFGEPETLPSPRISPAGTPPVVGQQSCRPAEPEIAAAARTVAGDIMVARPGVEGDADRIEVIVCKSTDSRATATVTVYAQRDDSVRDTRHELVLDKLVAQGWVVSSDFVTYRCQPGRGPQEFSPDRCV